MIVALFFILATIIGHTELCKSRGSICTEWCETAPDCLDYDQAGQVTTTCYFWCQHKRKLCSVPVGISAADFHANKDSLQQHKLELIKCNNEWRLVKEKLEKELSKEGKHHFESLFDAIEREIDSKDQQRGKRSAPEAQPSQARGPEGDAPGAEKEARTTPSEEDVPTPTTTNNVLRRQRAAPVTPAPTSSTWSTSLDINDDRLTFFISPDMLTIRVDSINERPNRDAYLEVSEDVADEEHALIHLSRAGSSADQLMNTGLMGGAYSGPALFSPEGGPRRTTTTPSTPAQGRRTGAAPGRGTDPVQRARQAATTPAPGGLVGHATRPPMSCTPVPCTPQPPVQCLQAPPRPCIMQPRRPCDIDEVVEKCVNEAWEEMGRLHAWWTLGKPITVATKQRLERYIRPLQTPGATSIFQQMSHTRATREPHDQPDNELPLLCPPCICKEEEQVQTKRPINGPGKGTVNEIMVAMQPRILARITEMARLVKKGAAYHTNLKRKENEVL